MASAVDRDHPSLSSRSFENDDSSPTILPWDRFSNWLHCVCVVTFDLELGQAMEVIYPSHVKLSEKEKMNICYLSFPDSNSGCMGDTQFNFRIRQHTSSVNRKSTTLSARNAYERRGPMSLQGENAYFHGFVYFRQVRDKTSRRGYFQKSVVLITKLPYINLFTQLIEIIAPEYFENGEPCLEAACHDIDQWAAPHPGEMLHLPTMGVVLQVRIPSKQEKAPSQSQIKKTTPLSPGSAPPIIIPSVNEVEVFKCFQPVLPHIQLLWELILTNEPIVVMAPSPTICSDTVQALVSMISPLRYTSDYRPYFTIHDSEFKEYTTKTQAPPAVVLGVTNPFFAKTLQHWPHIIRIGEMGPIGVYTRYKTYLNKDKSILKRLQKGIQNKRPMEVQDAMMRRHLLELTQSFMIPLERYVASLMPLQRNISPWKHPPRLRPFDPDEFVKTLEHSGPQLTSGLTGDWIGLYRRFFKSSNFEGWLRNRQQEVNQKLSLLHLEALCDADLMVWIKDKQEVEIVDLILRLRDKLSSVSIHQLPVKADRLKQLKVHMEHIISTLPEDLQSILKSN
ncbi:protein DENND6A-like isoform X2 [Ptychodera flava]|uniref:protein DENND6A-like isoform X2 n=1 Tax=Ptychodera flava TaxID=63121 RepID=UPI00396A2575